MLDSINFLFGNEGMMPHGYCFLWNPSLLWLFVIANTITALSYFSIPIALLYFVRQRKDVDFKRMLILFSLFIFTCGVTHVLSIVTIWKPMYGLSAIAEVLTASVSLATAIFLWPLIPQALRIPSPSSLLLANKKLEDEIRGHQETQAQLNTLNHQLDQLVERRTQELRASEAELRLSQISGGIGTWRADLINHTQTWSENCTSVLGFPPLSEPTWEDFLSAVHEDDRQRLIDATQAHIESNTQYRLEYRILTKNGNLRWMYSVGQVERNAEGKPYLIRGIVQDITQRKAHEAKISRLSNFYACLSKINHAIVQINNEADLFATVCTITASLSGVKLAWVGKPDAKSGIFVPLAIAGENQDYLSNITISSAFDAPEGQGPTGIAYRENRIVAINDFQTNTYTTPWHNNSEQHFAWAASCAVPILANKLPYAILNVYSKEKDFFDADVIALMAELSVDLSFALDSYAHEAARAIAEKQLELSAKVFSQSQEAILITDKNNIIISVNSAFTKVTGYQEQEVLGKNPNFLSSGQQDQAFYQALWKTLQKQDYWQGELCNRHKDGTLYPEWLTISVVRDDTGDVAHHIAIFTDISAHKATEKQIEHLAYYDALTDLPNRTLVTSRVDYELTLAKRHQKSFALLFIDLDHFKNINDSLGHSIGDQVLIAVVQRLLACVRDEDTVSRLGGDEFNILLIDSNEHGAAIVANKIIAALAKPIIYQGYQLHITPSIGISLYPDNGDSYELLSQNADTALYQAKDKGRNQYQFFTKAMQEKTQRRMAIESDLRSALLRNELMVYFQPQVSTQTGEIIGAEALLRWLHPQWGMVSPAEFIPIAEDCGLILPIGDWVLKQSIAQAKRWHEASFPITIAVNLSLVQFKDNGLLANVQQTLEDYHFPAQHLELELTESIAMQSVELAIDITQQLTQLGIKLSIDDFGTGFSSLNYLQKFSLHKLKIDQSFTRNMVSNKDSENIVDAIISLAKSLNLTTIAEGVETEQQLAMFKAKECDEIQGYYFSKPIPADEFMALMLSPRA